MGDEIPALRDQPFLAGSEKSFGEHVVCQRRANAQSTIANEVTFGHTNRSKKFVDDTTIGVDRCLVDRLRNIKQERFKRSSVGISCLRDEQIPDDTFSESARVLDNAFNVMPTKTGKSKNPVHSLGLVPFVNLEVCDDNKLGLKNARSSTEQWSLDEDHEEDLFSDSKDDVENVVEFSQWQYATNKSPNESFCGFSPDQIQSSRDIVTKLSQLDPVDICGDNDTPPLLGFSFAEQDTSERLVNKYKVENPKIPVNIVHHCPVATRSGNSALSIRDAQREKPQSSWSTKIESPTTLKQDNCKPEFPPGIKTVPPMQLISACGFSTAGGRSISVSETALAKAQRIYTEEISTTADESRDFSSEDLPESRNSSKLATHTPSVCGFSTAGGRAINLSKAAVIKAQQAYRQLDDCEAGSSSAKAGTTKAEEAMSRLNTRIGFTTAGGNRLKISEEALSRAKALYEQEASFADTALASKNLNSTDRSNDTGDSSSAIGARTTPDLDTNKETTSKFNAKVGFTTAGGNQLKISAEALLRAKNLYDQEASILDTALTSKNLNTTNNNHSGENPTAIGAQTATNFDNIESIDFDDFVDPEENDETSRKRKLNEADEETPIRKDEYSKPKRGRYFNELQARKLFVEDADDDAPTTMDKSQSVESAIRNKYSSTVNPENTVITDEISASAAALVEDEERSNDSSLWKSGAPSFTEIQKKPETITCQKKPTSPKMTSPKNMPVVNRSLRAVPSPSSNRSTRMDCNSLDIQPESIPDDLNFETQFSQDIQYYPLMDKFINETMKIMEARLAMTCKQDEIIRGKRGTKQQPRDGFLYKLRTSNRDSRIAWRTLTKGAAPTPRDMSNGSLEGDILSVTSASAESYSFRCADMFG